MTTTLTLCELGETGIEGLESYSPFCLKAHRALRAAGLSYERRTSARPDAFKALNPTGQVPVLLVGDEPIADSTRIVARISELGRSLDAGPTGRERAEAWLWEELADTALNGFLVASRWADARNWPAVREAYFAEMPAFIRAIVPARLRANVVATLVARDVWRAGEDECWRRFDALLDQLEARAPERGWWVGDRLSVADVALFAQLRSLRTPLTPWQASRVEARPTLCAWLDRVDHATRAPAVALAA
ncbi:glutathione S-transferase family protein [Sandaracinus amylolyticus]|uniref:glutathione S-transferase family protein n=1 Tax=Sandaracinus amylolyticus TaxID=927083 RepID=UPI001F38A344|nr:glutathione S-transferase family protein [Sandaracinus amylolyticus]UJR86831.1 Hypothetical protein I5071_89320 [Sandaracinus amylolyticus]